MAFVTAAARAARGARRVEVETALEAERADRRAARRRECLVHLSQLAVLQLDMAAIDM